MFEKDFWFEEDFCEEHDVTQMSYRFEYFCKEHGITEMSYGVEVLKACEECVKSGNPAVLMDHIEWEGNKMTNEVGKVKRKKRESDRKKEDLYDFINLSLDLKNESLFFDLTAELKNSKEEESEDKKL